MCRTPGLRAVLGAVVVVMMIAPGIALATAPYPVSYSFPHAVQSAAQSTTDGPLGANDWSCKPSPEHPYPVVLVHGLLANQVDNWDTMSPLLADNGFCVFALTYGTAKGETEFGGLTKIEQSSVQLGTFVNRVLQSTGAAKVDLVGHSEGTVMPRYWMEFLGGAALVSRYVMIAPLWHGTNLLSLGTLTTLGGSYDPSASSGLLGLFGSLSSCQSCSEFLTGSSFMAKLNQQYALRGVQYTNIMTRYDELVSPYTSGELDAPGVRNLVIQDQCPQDLSEHLTVAYDPNVAQDMLNGLDPAHARPVHCVPVISGVGAVTAPSGIGLSGAAPAPGVQIHYSLKIRPRHVHARLPTRFVFTLRARTGHRTHRVGGATVVFAGHKLRTNADGQAVITVTLKPRHGTTYRARASVGGRRVATAAIKVRR